jgi:NitT/TauT family transport system permease protein
MADTAGAAASTKVPAARVRSGRVARGVVGVAGFAVSVECLVRTGLIDPALLPAPSSVLVQLVALSASGQLPRDVVATLAAWGTGLVTTILIAVPIGILLGSLRTVNTMMRPVVEFLRPIPSVAIIPLTIVLAGGGLTMKTVVITYAASWPVVINTIYGLQDVDALAKDTLRSFGFGRLAVLIRVSLPSTVPYIVTGIRIASSIALVVTVSAEVLAGGTHGIGVFVMKSANASNSMELLLAAAIWAGALGLAANAALVRLERTLFAWHAARTDPVT